MVTLELATVYVGIGNSDDKLSRAEWSRYFARTRETLQSRAVQVHGEWHSVTASAFENACWCIQVPIESERALRLDLQRLAEAFRQDSIKYDRVPEPEFLAPYR